MAITRRELAMLGAWAQAQAAQHQAAPAQPRVFRVLDAASARDIEAIAAQIISMDLMSWMRSDWGREAMSRDAGNSFSRAALVWASPFRYAVR